MSELTHEIAQVSTDISRRDLFKLVGVSAAAVALGSAGVTLAPEEAFAATTIKCYTIKSSNTTVYSDAALTKKYGTIYGSDEITVKSIATKSCKVTYPVSKGTKTGYIPTSAILTKTSGSTVTASEKMITYKRPGGAEYGYVSKGDRYTEYGTSGDYVQIMYPVSGGYKIGWYKKPVNPTSSLQYPVTNYYVCGNNWRTYSSSSGGSGRHYHAGIDIKSKSGNTKIYAAAKGTVAAVGTNSANGKYVVIKHTISSKTVYSFYCHLKSYSVKKGTSVKKGQSIGVIGNTGSSSKGVHLHFTFANKLKSGSYYGYVPKFTGDKVTYSGTTYYNPHYVIKNGKLPS